jgi:hypothetical protein
VVIRVERLGVARTQIVAPRTGALLRPRHHRLLIEKGMSLGKLIQDDLDGLPRRATWAAVGGGQHQYSTLHPARIGVVPPGAFSTAHDSGVEADAVRGRGGRDISPPTAAPDAMECVARSTDDHFP